MSEAENSTFESYNENQRRAEAFTRGGAIAYQSAPPGSPVDGAVYIVLSPGSGAWSGQNEKVAERLNGAWAFYQPILNDTLVVGTTTPTRLRYDGTSWVDFGGGSLPPPTGLAPDTKAVTTAAIAVNASAQVVLTLAKVWIGLVIQTSAAAEIRIYQNTSDRSADLSRPTTTAPTVRVLQATTTAGGLTIPVDVKAIFGSTEAVRDASVPVTIFNRSTGTAAITLTFTYLPLES